MTSEVEIANLAVAFLGDEATITELDPPEGSAQAEHCLQFLPIARRATLELRPWSFATSDADLTLLTGVTVRGWPYAYTKPNCIKVWSVLPPGATDDYSVAAALPYLSRSSDGTLTQTPGAGAYRYTPARFKIERNNTTSQQMILTDQEDAQAICTYDVTDPNQFSPLFVIGLAKMLAAYIAGPIYKGKTGVEMSRAMMQDALMFIESASSSDGDQEHGDVPVVTPWMVR